MTPLALALVLAAALCHATWNLLAKRAGGTLLVEGDRALRLLGAAAIAAGVVALALG